MGLPESSAGQTPAEGLRELETERSFVGTHLREQLAYDVWAIMLGIWLCVPSPLSPFSHSRDLVQNLHRARISC